MANEIKASVSFSAQKDLVSLSKSLSGRMDWSNTENDPQTVALSNAITELPFNSTLTSLGLGLFYNNSETETLELGVNDDPVYSGNFVRITEIPPQCFALLPRLSNYSVYAARSLGDDADLMYIVLGR